MKFANLRLDDEVILWRKGAWPKQAKAITLRLMNTFRTGTWPARAARSLFRVKEFAQRATAHGRLSSGRLREDFAMRMLQTKIETTVLCEPGSRNAHGHLARFTTAVLWENEKWRAPRSGEPTPWGSLCGSLRSRNARWTSCRARLIEKIQ